MEEMTFINLILFIVMAFVAWRLTVRIDALKATVTRLQAENEAFKQRLS